MDAKENPEPAGPVPRVVALRYDERSPSAPRVVARGQGEVAQAILAKAAAHGVPIQSDADLLELLSGCSLGTEIPEELYSTVAELLTWLYGINSGLGAA